MSISERGKYSKNPRENFADTNWSYATPCASLALTGSGQAWFRLNVSIPILRSAVGVEAAQPQNYL